jgi:type IX secretion system PorP/SprF family membrane protein
MQLKTQLALLCLPLLAVGQDPIFLNANQSLIALNPSFAGSSGGVRTQVSYRNQWPGYFGSYVTNGAAADVFIKPVNAGIGLSLMMDDYATGLLRTNVLQLTYAQHITVGKNLRLIPSLSLAYGMRVPDKDRLYSGSSVDPRWGLTWFAPQPAPVPKKYVDASAGMVLMNEKFSAGVAVFHVNQPDVGVVGIYPLPPRIVLHGSYYIDTDNSKIQLMARTMMQGSYLLGQFNVQTLLMKHVILGAGYVSDNTALASAGYRTSMFSIALGYDYNFSNLASGRTNSWEVHTGFSIRKKSDRSPTVNFEQW